MYKLRFYTECGALSCLPFPTLEAARANIHSLSDEMTYAEIETPSGLFIDLSLDTLHYFHVIQLTASFHNALRKL